MRGREISMCGCLLRAPNWGPGLQPQSSALTENQTGDPLVRRLALNPFQPHQPGINVFFNEPKI